ncbi:MAG: nucleotide exchange factor GrpE [Alphaproteobacteria bacterium]|nr:nucleotide exchange factor GrpE [Alphaproteobacteria bacterium]
MTQQITGNDESAEAAEAALPTLESLQEQVETLKTDVLRAYADAENTKRRVMQDAEKREKYAVFNFAKELLTVVDSLERALRASTDGSAFRQGIQMTLDNFKAVFAKFKITEIPSVGQVFDPEFHQVVSQVPTADSKVTDGQIVEELQRGYLIDGRVLREAMVVVAKKDLDNEPV